MGYELAKKLKEAGFPQRFYKNPHFDNAGMLDGNLEDYVLSNPTLSELINACENGFIELSRHENFDKKWIATSYGIVTSSCSTPEEAVANLWLALHEKETKK